MIEFSAYFGSPSPRAKNEDFGTADPQGVQPKCGFPLKMKANIAKKHTNAVVGRKRRRVSLASAASNRMK
jgi:hypothetical protein